MAQEDENSLSYEEIEELLSDPSQSSTRDCRRCKTRYKYQLIWLCSIIVTSVFLNICLAVLLLGATHGNQAQEETAYGQFTALHVGNPLTEAVGLVFDKFDTINLLSPYGPNNKNESGRAIQWETLDGSSAQVAVDKSWAANKNLPPTQEFSWNKSKSVYSLRGFHAQHCLVCV